MKTNRSELQDHSESMTEGPDRRSFLGGMSALGVATVVGVVNGGSAQAAIPTSTETERKAPTLSSIANLAITREDVLNVPNGQEYFYEWEVGGDNGVKMKFLVHGSRLDMGQVYTVLADVTVHKFAAGADTETDSPVATSQQRSTTYGIKGVIDGNIRHDQVIVTTVSADGSVSREERTVPVRLDLGRFANQDLANHVLKAGRKRLAVNKSSQGQ